MFLLTNSQTPKPLFLRSQSPPTSLTVNFPLLAPGGPLCAQPAQRRRPGLGLYIVREILIAHGGEVTVESVEGQGTTFVLTFPAPE